MRIARSILPRRLHRQADDSDKQYFREFFALEDVSFEIRKGESWGFIGVNGSGKSTLLKIISGNLRPSRGSVEVDGKVAILDYGSGLNGEFSGEDNIYMKAMLLGLKKKVVDERFKSIVDFADIGEFIKQPVKTYSSGMAARLGFAIMAHVDAEIMITDEALAVGDVFFVQKCMAFIRSFIGKGTFLFVSHSTNDVLSLCQKAIWLEKGKVRAIGTAKEVTDAYLASQQVSRSLEMIGSATEMEFTASQAPAIRNGPREVVALQPHLSLKANSRIPRIVKDPRLEYVNRSPWRNDIALPELFSAGGGFGIGGAHIEDVSFEDEAGSTLSWIIGAEVVRLLITVRAERPIAAPIVGFQVKDRLGQSLFADNTFLTTVEERITVAQGQTLIAEFSFQMPLLPLGEYVIRVAVADGADEAEAAVLHCIDNAFVFRSVTSGARHGLIGVPMHSVRLHAEDAIT